MSSVVLADHKSLHYLLQSLSARERLYVDARVRGSMPVVAARMAGYGDPDAMAERLEKSDMVRGAVEYTLRCARHEQRHTREDVVAMLRHAYDVASTSGEMTAAAREIAKIEGHYAPQKVEVTGHVKVTKEAVAKLSDDELVQMAAIDAEFTVLEETEGGRITEGGHPGGAEVVPGPAAAPPQGN